VSTGTRLRLRRWQRPSKLRLDSLAPAWLASRRWIQAYVNLRQGNKDIVFENVEVPVVTETKFVIPTKMKWVVAIAIPMDIDYLAHAPKALGDAATGLGYSQSAFTAGSLAEFIRGLGYQAIPSVNDTAQSVPFAMDAGLGELSRLNKVVMLEFGAAIRLCKVLTDLPMEYDQPVDFGLAAFCRSCKMCAEACPPRALSFDDEPGYEVRGPWNNPGHKAWFEDSYRCLQYWQKVGNGCVSVLQAVRTPKSSKQCKTGSPNLRVVVDESRLTAELCRSTKWLSCGVPSSGSRLCRAPALPYADVEIHCALQVPPMIAGANSRIGRRLGWHNNVQPAATHSRAGSPTIRLEATVVG